MSYVLKYTNNIIFFKFVRRLVVWMTSRLTWGFLKNRWLKGFLSNFDEVSCWWLSFCFALWAEQLFFSYAILRGGGPSLQEDGAGHVVDEMGQSDPHAGPG